MVRKFSDIHKSLSFNSAIIRKCLLCIILSISLFQLFYLRFEYPYKQIPFNTWYFHHDEKLIIPDARYYFLKDTNQIDILDYKPFPVSASFGIAGPAIVALGFKIFGMNNIGLRFFFVVIAAITTVLCVFLILKVAPGPIGLLFSSLYIFSYNNFILHRHAILENFLTFFLIIILWLYIAKPKLLLNNLYTICFTAGISTLFKPNFVFYVFFLLFFISLAESGGIKKILKFVLFALSGILFFELIQFLILHGMGIAEDRYQNLITVLSSHLGMFAKLPGDILLLQHFRPVGLKIFLTFPIMVAQWYSISIPVLKEIYRLGFIIAPLFILLLICSIFFGIRKIISKEACVIALFITIHLLISSFFFYYLKRGIFIFPLMIVFLASFFYKALEFFFKKFPNIYINRIIKFFLIFITAVYTFFQIITFISASFEKTDRVEKNSIALDRDLPKNSVIYTHCYGYRFFWQVKEHRLLSGDDQVMSNSMMLDWAVKNHGRYIMLTGRSDMWTNREDSLFLKWLNKDEALRPEFLNNLDSRAEGLQILKILQRIKTLKLIKIYSTTRTESDAADRYFLMEIIYD